jgi:hypothetical protein
MAGAVDPMRAHRRFIHYQRRMIESLSMPMPGTTFNLGLPFSRGGLGFEFPPGVPNKISSFQRRFASYLEKKVREDVDKGTEPRLLLGLVTKAKADRDIPLYHNPTLFLTSSVGPLEQNCTLYTPRLYVLPALSQGMDPDRPDLVVKFPRKSDFKAFRSGTYPRMSTKDIVSWPYRLAERESLVESV